MFNLDVVLPHSQWWVELCDTWVALVVNPHDLTIRIEKVLTASGWQDISMLELNTYTSTRRKEVAF